jgi:hypothetical protein
VKGREGEAEREERREGWNIIQREGEREDKMEGEDMGENLKEKR